MNTEHPTCAGCTKFHRYIGENRGLCYHLPPVPLASGGSLRPTVKADDRACGQFQEGTASVKVKKQEPTHGAVVKSWHETHKKGQQR